MIVRFVNHDGRYRRFSQPLVLHHVCQCEMPQFVGGWTVLVVWRLPCTGWRHFFQFLMARPRYRNVDVSMEKNVGSEFYANNSLLVCKGTNAALFSQTCNFWFGVSFRMQAELRDHLGVLREGTVRPGTHFMHDCRCNVTNLGFPIIRIRDVAPLGYRKTNENYSYRMCVDCNVKNQSKIGS